MQSTHGETEKEVGVMHETGLMYDDQGLLLMSSTPPLASSAMFFSQR